MRVVIVLLIMLLSCTSLDGIEQVELPMVSSAYVEDFSSEETFDIQSLERLIDDLKKLKEVPALKYKAKAFIVLKRDDGKEYKLRTDGINFGPIGQKCYRSKENLLELYYFIPAGLDK